MLTRADLLWEEALFQCCYEPVHTPGHSQPFGTLVGTDIELRQITHVSENLPIVLGLTSNHLDGCDRWISGALL